MGIPLDGGSRKPKYNAVTNTVGSGVDSNLEYPLIIFKLGQIFHVFPRPVSTLRGRSNPLWVKGGLFCGLSKIFHSMDQSAAPDHDIMHWNILSLPEHFQTNIM